MVVGCWAESERVVLECVVEKSVLERPVLCLSGWRAWPVMAWGVARTLSEMTGASIDSFGRVSFQEVGSFSEAVGKVMSEVEEKWGRHAVELDVVAVSMGGLVARAAAAGMFGGERLRAKRLFTLASPHLGASLAGVVALDSSARDMKPGSDFLRALDEAERGQGGRGYELVCYARTRDWWVGAKQTAPEGVTPIWVDPPLVTMSHLCVTMDRRILGDVAHRLLGKEPILREHGAPPRN